MFTDSVSRMPSREGSRDIGYLRCQCSAHFIEISDFSSIRNSVSRGIKVRRVGSVTLGLILQTNNGVLPSVDARGLDFARSRRWSLCTVKLYSTSIEFKNWWALSSFACACWHCPISRSVFCISSCRTAGSLSLTCLRRWWWRRSKAVLLDKTLKASHLRLQDSYIYKLARFQYSNQVRIVQSVFIW